MGFLRYSGWHQNTAAPRKSTVMASMGSYPTGRCCGCGTRRKLIREHGLDHCQKSACAHKAARILGCE